MDHFVCCFTGHRHFPSTKIAKIITRLDKEIERLIARGVTDFISGGAVGFDQMAASLIVAKKEVCKNIRLIFALPCKNQEAQWQENQKTLYYDLLKEADKIIYVSQEYTHFCMKRRNYYMVDRSSHCICALLHDRSGTSQTVSYAEKRGLQIINVANELE